MDHEGSAQYIYVATRWEGALDSATAAMEDLERIYPSHLWILTETGGRAVEAAMSSIREGLAHLMRSGRYVLGQEVSDQLMEERSAASQDNHSRGDT